MLLAELVSVADAVAATPARSQKVALLAELLRALDAAEAEAAVGFLIGDPVQGRIGIGWATAWRVTASHAARPTLTIADLDDALRRIQATTGKGSVGARDAVLRDLMERATPPEADFVRRLLTAELRQGALEGVMGDAIARAADVPAEAVRRAAMLSGDVRRTAVIAIAHGIDGLRAVGLTMFTPILPMLASTSPDVGVALAGLGEASVEWKLDGVRIQVHRAGDEVRVYTRNLNDVTERLPGVADVVRSLPAERLMLDGEAIGLDETERPHPFQETMSRVGRRVRSAMPVAASFFDCLHLDGTDLIDRPLVERAHVLERVAGRWRIPAIATADAGVAERFLADALDAGHEGVMVKSLDGPYQAGRRGKSWRKVKPVATLDLVVLGAEWGHGRRRGRLSNLHLGARAAGGGFVMVGKTFKGLTDEMLRWQTQRLLELERAREGIVVWTRPELVVEIALDGVQSSTRYPGGVALRFARVKRYRTDKGPRDADTIEAVRALLPER